ncbi:tyrosine-type recombinase/integrase [Caballeronia ptereochthonis]|uniref:Integrase protein n=1 Tax=Caballeronia ptereochthonis TaxID=1777144 RepID=A0A158CIF4_9BURK|nr:site-specific integrase [Caballeronia ptereochthonis]SAK82062.1 integrase protein [Caballeronia ptereochthonis]
MAKIKLTKSAVDAAEVTGKDYELRDTIVPGFLCKVTARGRKVFMLQYRTNWGERRKPKIGQFGELTIEQARSIAQDWLADVRKGNDPSAAKLAARLSPTVKELCAQFMEEYSRPRNKPSTVDTYQDQIDRFIVPMLGRLKVPDVTRQHITTLMRDLARIPVTANRVLSCIRKMLNMAEVWGYRPDGSNPCRHVPKYPENGETRYIVNDELVRLYAYLDRADAEGLEHPTLTLAVRLQFEFSARMSEIRLLEWSWIDFENRRIAWPDSKTGDISKPMSEVAYQLLSNAYRIDDSPYVCPAIFDSSIPLPESTYYNGWKRVLKRANVIHVGTHGIRHRAATDIANSGIPVKVGMALTAHKTVSMFMRYVHAEDDPIRAAAEKVANLRRDTIDSRAPMVPVASPAANTGGTDCNKTLTSRGNYRPYRHRKENSRAVPPGSKRDLISEEEAA